MSWAVQGIGKPKALIAKLPDEFDRTKCDEPEQTIKAKAKEIVLLALDAYPDDSAVKITASGSQSKEYREGMRMDRIVNSLNISVEPLWGFVE